VLQRSWHLLYFGSNTLG